jgi:autotransporter-associated beta strand protein
MIDFALPLPSVSTLARRWRAFAVENRGRLAGLLIPLLFVSPAVAQSGTWNKPTGGSWGTASNWLDGVIPTGFYETADFSTQNPTANATVTLDGPRTIGTLIFGDTTPSHDWTLVGGSGGTLTLDAPGSVMVTNRAVTISAGIAGNYGILKEGPGTLTLTAASSNTGMTFVTEGTLRLGYNSGSGGTLRGNLMIQDGATVVATVGNALGYAGSNWVRSIMIDGGTLEAAAANSDQGWGVAYVLNGGTLNASASGSRFAAGGGTSVMVQPNVRMSTINGEFRLREGNPNDRVVFNLINGEAHPDLSVNGPIGTNGTTRGIEISGDGALRTAGTCSYTGPTVVSSGTLVVTGSLATTTTTVASSATLAGSGTLGGPTTITGTLSPGDASIATLRINNTLALNAAATTVMEIGKTGATRRSDLIQGITTLTMGGTLKINLEAGSEALAPGDTFTLFSASSRSGSFATVNLPALSGTYRWDTSLLASQGRITVAKGTQTLTFGPLATATMGEPPFELTAVASSGLPVSFGSSNESVAVITGNVVTLVGSGTTVITASQAGDASYLAAPSIQQTLTVNRAVREPQTITFPAPATVTNTTPPFTLGASASSGLAVSYTSSNAAVATISGNVVTIKGAGTTLITARQPGNTDIEPAPDVAHTLLVTGTPQTVTFGPLPIQTLGNRPLTLTANSTSGLPITYLSSDETVATIAGNTVNWVGAGTATITATQPGNATYDAAPPVAQPLTVNPAATAVTVTPEPIALEVRSGETATLPVTLTNPTTGAVEWNLALLDGNGNLDTLEGALAAINASGTTLNGPLPSRYDFTEGETGTAIATGVPSGSTGIFNQGNKLTTNLGGPLAYSNNAVAAAAALGTGGRYFTRKLPGLFLMGAELNGVSWFEVAGALVYGQERATSQFTLTRHGKRWAAFVAKSRLVYGQTVNHLILVDQDGLTQSIGTSSSDQKHRVADLTGRRRLYYLMFVSNSSSLLADAVFESLATRLLDTLPVPFATFLEIAPAAGTTPAGGTAAATLSADAFGLPAGNFPATLKVGNPAGATLKAVPVSLDVTAPRLTVPATITHATVSGVVPATVEIPLASNLPEPQAWSASLPGAPAWLSLVTAAGTTPTPLSLRFTPGALAAGTYYTTLRLTSGPALFEVPVTFRVDALAIAKFRPDPAKPLIYALNKNGIAQGQLVVIDAIGRSLLRTIPLGQEPTDLDFTEDGSRLVVINSKDPSLSFIDLATLQVVETIPLTSFSSRARGTTEPGAHVKCGKGSIIYYVDEQWGPRLRVFDSATRTVLQVLGAGSATSPNTNNDEGYGDIGLNPARTRLYGWRQYGDGAGFAGTNLIRFDIAADGTLTGYTRGADNNLTNFTREPLDTPVLFSPDGGRLIIKDREVDQENLNVFPKIYLDEIYALATNGSIAISAGAIHNLQTADSLGALPVTTSVQALLPDLSALVYFNTTAKTLGWVDLEAALGAPALGLTVTPANNAVVTNPTRLEWPAITGITRYRIYLGTNQAEVLAATPGSASDLGETTATFLTLPAALATNQRYFWRVVPIGSDGNPAGAGTVRSFTASSFLLAPSSFTLRLPLTIQPQTISIAVTGADGQPAAWSVSESIAWFVPDATSGAAGTPLTGRITATGLTAGNYSGSLTVTAAGMSLAVPIAVTFYTPEIIVMKPDPSRDWVYGLHRGSTTADESQLLAIRAATGAVEKALSVGSNAQDFAINPVTDRLYVANTNRPRMQVVDLAAFALLPPLAVPSDIIGVAADHRGRIFASRNQALAVLDAATGAPLGAGSSAYSYNWGVVDAAGTRYYTMSTGTNGEMVQYDVTADAPVYLRKLNLYSNSSERPLLSTDGTRFFAWGRAFDPELNAVGASGEHVKCTVSNGQLAVGATKVWWVKSTTQAAALPFTASVSTVSRNDQFLLLYNATTRAVTSVRLDSLVPFPGLSPEPGESFAPGQPAALSWPTVTDAVSYRVFLGTTEAEVLAAAAGSALELGTTATTTWDLAAPLPFGSRYFWRVDAIKAGGAIVKGVVWWFEVPMPELAPTLTVAPASSNPAGLFMTLTEFGLGMTHLQDWGYHSLRLDPADGRPSLWQSYFNNNASYYPGLKYIIGQQTAVLGIPGYTSSSSPGANDGKLILQKLVNGRWQDTTTLAPPSLPEYARLGSTLAYDGNLFMAGMPSGAAGGRVAVYREYPEFTFMQEIKPSDGAGGNNFGASIALQGNRALIGAPGGWTTNGKAYIFEFQPATRTWVQRTALVPPVPSGGTGVDITHGAAVALDGDTAVLGSGSSNVNQANIYTRSTDTSWVKTATLTNPKGTATSSGFGTALALAGNTLFVTDLSAYVRGAEAGIVYVFQRSGSTWRIGATIQPPVGAWRFGYALAARDGVLYVSSATAVHCYRIADLANRAPRFAAEPPSQFVVGRALDQEVIVTDADGTAGVTLQAEVLPTGLVFEDLGGGRARLSGTPSGVAGATHFLRWKATDPAGASVYQTSQVTLVGADQLPVLATSPLTQQPPVGSDVVLTAAATGVGPFRWQWQKDGEDIPGATGPKLVLNEITAAATGTYAVSVTNVVGTVTSADAVVTVRAPDLNAGNWETFGNSPAHHGHHPAALAGHRLEPAWSVPLAANTSGNVAVIADGRVHLLSTNYGTPAPLRTFELATGTESWTFPFSASSYVGPPTVRGGRVYFQRPGILHCLNAATGATEWTNSSFSSQGYPYGPLAVTDDGIFAINGYYGSIMGFETTGATRFSVDLSATNGWAPAVLDGRVFTWSNGTFREHSTGDGSTLWSLANLAGDAAFAVRSGCAVLASQTALSCVDLNTRALRWQTAGAFRSLPAIAGGRAYASQSTAVRSYALADGTPGPVYQTTATTGAPLTSQPVILHDRLIAASAATTWVFNLADGTLLQTLAGGGNLSYANGFLLVAGNDRTLRAFRATPQPELAVEFAGAPLANGAATADFGAILLGQPVIREFTIRNTGQAELSGLAVTIDGAAAAEYELTTPPAAAVAPGGSTPFTITFTPTAPGTRTAALRLASNDPVANPFAIALSGLGNRAPTFAGYATATTANRPLTVFTSKIAAKAGDPDGDAVTLTQAFGPASHGGGVSLASGVLTYTPPAGFTGNETVEVELSDVHGAAVRGLVTFTVAAEPAGAAALGLNLTEFILRNGKAEMVFRGIPGRAYTIERSSDLTEWVVLATVTAGADGRIAFSDSAPPVPQAFYRTRAN